MSKEPLQEQIVLKTIKGFNKDLMCRGLQFEVGKTYEVYGEIVVCKNGFHACEYPLDVFSYYTPASSLFHEVEQSVGIARHADDSKIASAKITIGVEISLHAMALRAVDWVMSKVDFSISPATNTGYYSAATNTGYYSAATNTGFKSAATNTGDYSAATNTGDGSASEVSGKHSVAIATGFQSKARAGVDGAICLVCRDERGAIVAISASKIGENGLEPDIWYSLDKDGNFIKAEDE